MIAPVRLTDERSLDRQPPPCLSVKVRAVLPLFLDIRLTPHAVLNKYFPPDFDPDLIPRRKGTKNSQQVVRLMAPFSMRCNTCGEYIYKGKKFNARKETVQGEDYYGIKIFRFYIKWCVLPFPLCATGLLTGE